MPDLQKHSPFETRLRHCTLVENPASTKTKLVVGRETFDLTREGDRDQFLALKSLLDGRHCEDEMVKLTGINRHSVRQVVGAFSEMGLFQARQPRESLSIDGFIEKIEASSLMWRRQIDLHPLFGGLLDQTYRSEVFIGFLIETYHYVRRLPAALLSVLDAIDDRHIRHVVRDYAMEELDHYRTYEPVLTDIERIGPWIANSHPCPGTLAVVRGFEAVGRRNGLSLACCLQLIEARATETRSAERHLRTIAAGYEMEHLVEPYLDHMKADIELGHAGLLENALSHLDAIALEDAHGAVNDMHDIKHGFDLFHDSIIDYYSDISNYIPRPKVDFFAL